MRFHIKVSQFQFENMAYRCFYEGDYLSNSSEVMPSLRFAYYKGFREFIKNLKLNNGDLATCVISICYVESDVKTHLEFYIERNNHIVRIETPGMRKNEFLIKNKIFWIKDFEKKYRVKLS